MRKSIFRAFTLLTMAASGAVLGSPPTAAAAEPDFGGARACLKALRPANPKSGIDQAASDWPDMVMVPGTGRAPGLVLKTTKISHFNQNYDIPTDAEEDTTYADRAGMFTFGPDGQPYFFPCDQARLKTMAQVGPGRRKLAHIQELQANKQWGTPYELKAGDYYNPKMETNARLEFPTGSDLGKKPANATTLNSSGNLYLQSSAFISYPTPAEKDWPWGIKQPTCFATEKEKKDDAAKGGAGKCSMNDADLARTDEDYVSCKGTKVDTDPANRKAAYAALGKAITDSIEKVSVGDLAKGQTSACFTAEKIFQGKYDDTRGKLDACKDSLKKDPKLLDVVNKKITEITKFTVSSHESYCWGKKAPKGKPAFVFFGSFEGLYKANHAKFGSGADASGKKGGGAN